MELTWLESLLFGLISGFTEFLPLSSVAHQTIFLKLFGGGDATVFHFFATLGSLTALLVVFFPVLLRIRMERQIAAIPRNRRRRQPDLSMLMESRILGMAWFTSLVLIVIYTLVWNLYERMWVLAGIMVVNGIVIFVPAYLPGANKGPRSLSSLDAMLIGLASGLGIIPGLSRVGCAVAAARLRGADRRYATNLAFMVSIPSLAVLTIIQFIGTITSAAWTGVSLLSCATVLLASFGAGYLAIHFLRFLSVKTESTGFAYYCWGAALFTLLLYLI